jgi:hypothetical protein
MPMIFKRTRLPAKDENRLKMSKKPEKRVDCAQMLANSSLKITADIIREISLNRLIS